MSNQRIGWSGTTLQEIPGSPFIRRTDDGPEVTETFNVNYADAETAITARGIAFGADCPVNTPTYAAAKLDEITINKIGPKNGRVSYIYRMPEASGSTPAVGTIIKEADSNAIEIPIGLHPNASGTNYNSQEKIGVADWEGIEAYLSPQPVYSRTETIASFTFSEANVIENVARRFTGAQMNTAGLSSATDNRWLLMQLSIKTSGSRFEKIQRWQYADNGWNTDLYDAAS